jgi:26S proteasome regulatory subunit T5
LVSNIVEILDIEPEDADL